MHDVPATTEWRHTASEFRQAITLEQAVINEDRLTLSTPGRAVLISLPIDAGHAVDWDRLYWDAGTPKGSSVLLRTRFGNTLDELESARWSAPYIENYSEIRTLGSQPMAGLYTACRFIQYQVELFGIHGALPEVTSIRLTCRPIQPSGYWPKDQSESHPEELIFK